MKGNPANHNVGAIDAINAAVRSIRGMGQLRKLVDELDDLHATAIAKMNESETVRSREIVQQKLREAAEALTKRDGVSQEIIKMIRTSG